MKQKLIDPHGRHIHKLRLALLDACNFRCMYCMPTEVTFMDASKLLSLDQIIPLCQSLTDLGIDEIRLTGGEPTLRADLMDIIQAISELPLKKFGLTTNGTRVAKLLPEMAKTKCQYLNFSLDSLNRETFRRITGKDELETVLHSILMAKELGFIVKVNTVLMRGINDQEIEDFVEFSALNDIEVRFLELMKIGIAREKFDQQFMPADEVIRRIDNRWERKIKEVPIDSTSFNFRLNNNAQIGFIASESKPFCGGCSRLRLSAEGTLRPCLMVNDGISLKNKNKPEIEKILKQVMGLKPIDRIHDVDQGMFQIGG